MKCDNPELLNEVYREICNEFDMETTQRIYEMFKGQQITFPVRLLNAEKVYEKIQTEYDGTNVRYLSVKYEYSEKTVRRILKQKSENEHSK